MANDGKVGDQQVVPAEWVIVKLSDYGDVQDEEETIDVFRSLADSCT